MQLHAAMRKKQPEILENAYTVADILELSELEYASLYQDLLEDREYFAQRANTDGAILILGENQKNGILVETQGYAYADRSAFIPDARLLVRSHIRQLANYCVSEGTQHSEDGSWSIPYEELKHHFSAEISDTNGNGQLLREELQQREEINELIMAEDCIEISYHLEYCENCQQGGVNGTMDLLSLMGCNLYDVHFTHESGGHDFPVISRLGADTLTEQGKKEWTDILSAKIQSIKQGCQCLECRLTDCDPFRAAAFAQMLNGQCKAEDYERWVRQRGISYASEQDKPHPTLGTKYNADLAATYEELLQVPYEQKITDYFGDYGLHHFKHDVTEEQIRSVYDKALAAVEMTDDEFNSHKEFIYRSEIIGRMRDCLLAKELKTGEEVLFVATEPYGGEGDFELRGGIILGVYTERKTCKVRGEFFTMEDIPMRYVLGRHDLHAKGKHYGFEHVQPLFGEHPALAQQYLREVKEAYNARMNLEQVHEDETTEPVLSM